MDEFKWSKNEEPAQETAERTNGETVKTRPSESNIEIGDRRRENSAKCRPADGDHDDRVATRPVENTKTERIADGARDELKNWQAEPGRFSSTLTPDGRPHSVEGWLVDTSRERTTQEISNQRSVCEGMPSEMKWHGGHLIGHRFGCPAETWNLVPMEQRMNCSYVSGAEEFISKEMQTKDVYLKVTVTYDGDSARSVRHEAFERSEIREPRKIADISTRIDQRASYTVGQAEYLENGRKAGDFYESQLPLRGYQN